MVEQEIKEEPSVLESAAAIAQRIEDANKRTEELLKKQEELIAREKLGGRTVGFVPQEKPREDTPQEYAAKLMRGEIQMK